MTDNEAKVLITRKKYFWGRGKLVKLKVVIDNQVVGKIGVGESAEFPVAPGNHKLRVASGAGYGSEEWGVKLRPGEVGQFVCTDKSFMALGDLFRAKEQYVDLRPVTD